VGSAQQPDQQSDSAVLFCFIEGRLLALHGFIKKTQKTPDAELEIARKRMSEFKQQKKPKAPKEPKKKEAP
jgi:phage-related protein